MNIFELLLIGLGLSMDACAVSMTNGMCYKQIRFKHTMFIGLSFGVSQGLMPLIGYYAGSIFSSQISVIDHWIALILLSVIGGKMIYDGLHHDHTCSVKPLTSKLLLLQSIATSIDALAVGISFAAMNVNIYVAVSIIAGTTFVLSVIAVWLGKKMGDKLNSKAEIFGGTILILIGIKIFVQHTFFG